MYIRRNQRFFARLLTYTAQPCRLRAFGSHDTAVRRLKRLNESTTEAPWVRVFRQNLYFTSAVQQSVCVQLVNKSFQGGCYRFVFLVEAATVNYAPISAGVFLAGERDALTTPHAQRNTRPPAATANCSVSISLGQKAHVRPNRRAPVTHKANVGINQNGETKHPQQILLVFLCLAVE